MSERTEMPLLGLLRAQTIKREFGANAERRLENLVARIVQAAAAQSFGRCIFENVYLAGFEHGARLMERKLTEPSHD